MIRVQASLKCMSTKEKESVKTELDVTVSKLEMIEREQESSLESEVLRGQVHSLSGSLSQEQAQHRKFLDDLNAKLSHINYRALNRSYKWPKRS